MEGASTTADVARRAGIRYRDAKRFLEAILKEIALGNTVRLGHFGEFRLTEIKAREVETPIIPGGLAKIPRTVAIRFRAFSSASRNVREWRTAWAGCS